MTRNSRKTIYNEEKKLKNIKAGRNTEIVIWIFRLDTNGRLYMGEDM